MQTPEQIAYEVGRDALSEQESLVVGIRQRTGTLLAAHALVASFLGSATLRAQGASPLAWEEAKRAREQNPGPIGRLIMSLRGRSASSR